IMNIDFEQNYGNGSYVCKQTLVTKAKDLAGAGKIKEALDFNERALSIYHSEKLVRRITKMKVNTFNGSRVMISIILSQRTICM
ncbi:hypothetical protein LSH36_1002g03049, partial [Paralvinella palmiformis]